MKLGTRSLLMVPCHVASILPANVNQVHDYRDVGKQYDRADHGRFFDQLKDLDGYIEAAGNYCKPFGPGLQTPQAIRFNEAHAGVAKSQRGEKANSAGAG